MGEIHARTLRCGAELFVEKMSGVASAGVAWLLPAGSGSDPRDKMGLSAIASEMLMRGAGSLDSRAQADAFDRVGATRSIDTSGYYTSVRSACVGARLHEVLPLLVDTVRAPRFEADALDPSRELCLQALASLKDDPRERAMLAAKARHLPAPLNRSGYGTEEGLASVALDDVRGWWSSHALPGGSAIAVAGDVDPDGVAAQFDELLDGWSGAVPDLELAAETPRGYAHETDATNQVQVLVAMDAPPDSDPDASLREKVGVSVLSGGMSGRLFTEVREKRGLCYAVSASYRGDRSFGLVQAYVGTEPDRAQESLDVLVGEMERIRTEAGRIDEDEFARAIVGMKSGVVFHGESTGARAGAMVGDWHRLGRARTLEEIAERIDRVTIGEVREHFASRPLGRLTIQTLGPTELTPPG